jgi:hypothetical protein
MKKFEKLVVSPYFNKGRNYLPFLNELKKFYPKFDNDKLTPEYIHSKLYPGKKFNRQIVWNMTSGLLNMTEELMIHIDIEKHTFERNCHAADELYVRKLTRLYEQKLKTMEKNVDRLGIGEILFKNKILLELRKINLFFLEDRQEMAQNLVPKKGEFLILYFLVVISNVINNMHYYSLLYNTSYSINITYEFIKNLRLDKVIEYAAENNYEYAYVMELYYCMIMTSLSPENTSFFLRAKELFEHHSHKLDNREREVLRGVLINYCVYKVNNGEVLFRKMLFEINLHQLNEIDKMQSKGFSKVFYIQVLRNALSSNEIDWAKKYIEKYTPYLKHSYRKSMKTLAEALLAFKLKNFDKIIENLSKVKFLDTRDKYYVKSLTLRAYYELGEIPALYYYIDSTKQFVSKNPSLGKLTRKNFYNFINCLNRMLAMKEKNNFFGLEKMKNEIEQEKNIVNRDWLLEKIEKIMVK